MFITGKCYFSGGVKKNRIFNSIIGKKTITDKNGKKVEVPKTRYFLTFDGDGQNLYNLLHKEFKTKIFKGNKGTIEKYVDNISLKNKEILMEIIHKHLHIGKGISAKFAEYLIRLEAHMLLEKKDSWFVVENNEDLFTNNCFKKNSRKIINKSAFVEISQDDYNDINTFLKNYHSLSDNDFLIETEDDKNKKKKD